MFGRRQRLGRRQQVPIRAQEEVKDVRPLPAVYAGPHEQVSLALRISYQLERTGKEEIGVDCPIGQHLSSRTHSGIVHANPGVTLLWPRQVDVSVDIHGQRLPDVGDSQPESAAPIAGDRHRLIGLQVAARQAGRSEHQ